MTKNLLLSPLATPQEVRPGVNFEDKEYLKSLSEALTEWSSQDDEEAYTELQNGD